MSTSATDVERTSRMNDWNYGVRAQSIQLFERGLSRGKIAKQLGVAKSSVSSWVSGLEATHRLHIGALPRASRSKVLLRGVAESNQARPCKG